MVETTNSTAASAGADTTEAKAKVTKKSERTKVEFFTNQGVDIIRFNELADIMIAKYASHEKQTEATKLQGYLRAICEDINILNDMFVGSEGVKTQYNCCGDVFKREEYLAVFEGTVFEQFIIPGTISLDGTLAEWTINLRKLENKPRKLNKTPGSMGADIARVYSFFRKAKGEKPSEPYIDVVALQDVNLADKSICRTTSKLPIILKDFGPGRFESVDRRDFETTKFVMRRLLLDAMSKFGS